MLLSDCSCQESFSDQFASCSKGEADSQADGDILAQVKISHGINGELLASFITEDPSLEVF